MSFEPRINWLAWITSLRKKTQTNRRRPLRPRHGQNAPPLLSKRNLCPGYLRTTTWYRRSVAQQSNNLNGWKRAQPYTFQRNKAKWLYYRPIESIHADKSQSLYGCVFGSGMGICLWVYGGAHVSASMAGREVLRKICRAVSSEWSIEIGTKGCADESEGWRWRRETVDGAMGWKVCLDILLIFIFLMKPEELTECIYRGYKQSQWK